MLPGEVLDAAEVQHDALVGTLARVVEVGEARRLREALHHLTREGLQVGGAPGNGDGLGGTRVPIAGGAAGGREEERKDQELLHGWSVKGGQCGFGEGAGCSPLD